MVMVMAVNAIIPHVVSNVLFESLAFVEARLVRVAYVAKSNKP